MANADHLAILHKGVQAWNTWRAAYPKVKPDLEGADLRRADLTHANFSGTRLIGADLSDASLLKANFTGALLIGAILINTRFFETQFSDTDLTNAIGLESCKHLGPSILDHWTLQRTGSEIATAFLVGCGLPQKFAENMRALLVEQPIQHYSCFISYSSKDEEFIGRLYGDLQGKGVRTWYAPEDLKIGERFRTRIDEVIRIHDKLLLVLSEHSVNSTWVEKEVETAFEQESERGSTVLFPIRLDSAVMKTSVGWAADVKRTRHIGDFSEWRDDDFYNIELDRLVKDLAEKEGGSIFG